MKIKALLTVMPAVLFMACGGAEGDSSSDSEGSEGGENSSEYHTSFGECTANGSTIAMMTPTNADDSIAVAAFDGFDLGLLTSASAELTESHDNLYIKFATSDEVLDKSPGSYEADDHYVSITIQNTDTELEAGDFSKEGLANNGTAVKISVIHRSVIDGSSKSKTLGSNKITHNAVVNDLSESHVCGTYSMNSEDGSELVSASFDLDVKVVMF